MLLCVLGLGFFYSASDNDFVPVLDHANLVFHEAGHVFFGLLGETAGLYGGTTGQFVYPAIATVVFLKKAQWFAAALALVWLFQNMIYMAQYMADARSRNLPLAGGGEHDWYNIFSRSDLLSSDIAIANLCKTIAWLGMIGTLLWLGRKWALAR